MLASYQGAKTLLGTATPSIESWYNAQSGKYGIVSLSHRFQDIKLPEILPVDMKEMRRTRQVNGIFSFELIKHISTALQGHEQIILFQNRRGFAPMIDRIGKALAQQAHEQRNTRAVDDAAEEIAPQRIGPEGVLP